MAGQQFEYLYDPIGNRTTTRFGGDVLGGNLRSSTASFNALNQLFQLTTPGYRSILGSATAGLEVTVSVNSANATALRQGGYYCRCRIGPPLLQPLPGSICVHLRFQIPPPIRLHFYSLRFLW